MARKSTKSNSIDSTALTAAALKACKCAGDYYRLDSTTDPSIFQSAWSCLTESEQQRITDIVNNNTQPEPQAIADELVACGTLIELQGVKSQYGELAIKSAWKLLPAGERDRLTVICRNETQPELEPVTETPASYEVEHTPPEPPAKKTTLIDLSEQLQQLDNLLDTIDNDIPVELQTAVDDLLSEREATHEALLEKLDSYAALIQSRLMWAAARKAEADRLAKLAEKDIKTVEFLKARLKAYLETTDQKKLRTKRFNISMRTAGGKLPLRLSVQSIEQLPKRFQRVTVEPDNAALREALEADEPEAKEVAYFAERTTYVAIN